MKIVGFGFKKIAIEKKKEAEGNIDINRDIQIKDISKAKIDLFSGEENTFSIEYEFKINYKPEIGFILFEGNLILLVEKSDKDLGEKISNAWKKKELLSELQIPILNLIFDRCHLKALELETMVNLPPHTPTPRFTKKHTEQ